MKKLILLGVVALAGVALAAGGTYYTARGTSGTSYTTITWDSTTMVAKVRLDSTNSDVIVLDTAYLKNSTKGAIAVTLGTVKPCDSCNDSMTIYTLVRIKTPGAQSWRQIDSFALGGNNITALDDKSVNHALAADSIIGSMLQFKTVVKDSCLSATCMNSGGVFVAQRSIVPVNIEVLLKP